MKKMKTFSVIVGDIMCFEVPKRGMLQLEGVLQLGGIRYWPFDFMKRGTPSKFGLGTRCLNSNKYDILHC